MASIDVFHSDPFTMIELTSAVERNPFLPTGIGAYGFTLLLGLGGLNIIGGAGFVAFRSDISERKCDHGVDRASLPRGH